MQTRGKFEISSNNIETIETNLLQNDPPPIPTASPLDRPGSTFNPSSKSATIIRDNRSKLLLRLELNLGRDIIAKDLPD